MIYSHRIAESPESTTVTFMVAEAGLVGSRGEERESEMAALEAAVIATD